MRESERTVGGTPKWMGKPLVGFVEQYQAVVKATEGTSFAKKSSQYEDFSIISIIIGIEPPYAKGHIRCCERCY